MCNTLLLPYPPRQRLRLSATTFAKAITAQQYHKGPAWRVRTEGGLKRRAELKGWLKGRIQALGEDATIIDILCREGFTSIRRVCRMTGKDMKACKFAPGDQQRVMDAISASTKQTKQQAA